VAMVKGSMGMLNFQICVWVIFIKNAFKMTANLTVSAGYFHPGIGT